MLIRALRVCHHCAVPLSEDETLHYVVECHVCVMSEHDLEAAIAREPDHPDAPRFAGRAFETVSVRRTRRRPMPRRAA